MNAMILAAGVGSRMRPLTDSKPKPLLEVNGKSLIAYHLEALEQAGFSRVVINVHHLKDMLMAHVDGLSIDLDISYSVEDELLETAGGIRKALPILGGQPFAVVSADIFTAYNFDNLPHETQMGHLIMVPNPPHHPEGDFAIDDAGILRFSGEKRTWASIALFHPRFFAGDHLGPQKLRVLMDQEVGQSTLTGELYLGRWSDAGTPERLAALNQ